MTRQALFPWAVSRKAPLGQLGLAGGAPTQRSEVPSRVKPEGHPIGRAQRPSEVMAIGHVHVGAAPAAHLPLDTWVVPGGHDEATLQRSPETRLPPGHTGCATHKPCVLEKVVPAGQAGAPVQLPSVPSVNPAGQPLSTTHDLPSRTKPAGQAGACMQNDPAAAAVPPVLGVSPGPHFGTTTPVQITPPPGAVVAVYPVGQTAAADARQAPSTAA